MGAPLGQAGAQRQRRLGAVERLDLGLLIDTDHKRALRRVEVETDDAQTFAMSCGSFECLKVRT